jgi:hypothetical protein
MAGYGQLGNPEIFLLTNSITPWHIWETNFDGLNHQKWGYHGDHPQMGA